MKLKLGMVAGVMAAALAVGPVAAADYQGLATYGFGNWSIQWAGASCDTQDLLTEARKPTIMVIDGVPHTPSLVGLSPSMPVNFSYSSTTLGGNLTSVLIDGQSSFQCGGDTYLLPGYVAPPAPVPTMSEWAMILLGVVLAGGAALVIQRRRLTA